jgi:hypothetical protein
MKASGAPAAFPSSVRVPGRPAGPVQAAKGRRAAEGLGYGDPRWSEVTRGSNGRDQPWPSKSARRRSSSDSSINCLDWRIVESVSSSDRAKASPSASHFRCAKEDEVLMNASADRWAIVQNPPVTNSFLLGRAECPTPMARASFTFIPCSWCDIVFPRREVHICSSLVSRPSWN